MNKKMRRMILLTVALGVCWLSQSPARAEDLDGLNSQTKCNTFCIRCCDGTMLWTLFA